ncbi:RNA polymerase factor sigma-54 [Orenia marismortui]|uniref:RNA polymerase RpoN-/SigL-like sigma 54 subunit n=1 Tax=Orenia marismortui TaxID=46469 RepID=A0A4R8HLA2_9FIRM|nr:RNA polymerase factor sigma-54 [Orenia marismortui]TDX59134.1 RNA polymerase RpoN-/SigL-like sigma 54 subunit [Orenia marismortui]
MDFKQEFNLKQEQKMIMTPKLQQAIELLQFSTLELRDYIEEEIIDNPLLELEDIYSSSANYSGEYYSQEGINYQNFIADRPSLDEYLCQQLYLVADNKLEEEIGQYIIGNLDDSGFFTDKEKVKEELKVSDKEIEVILSKIKKFQPLGIAANNMEESLLLQLDNLTAELDIQDINLAKKIICDYLSELSKNQVSIIAKKLSLELDHAQKLIDLIKSLTPIPVEGFNDLYNNSYLEPDVILKRVKGDYIIIMDERSFPTLRINRYYKKILEQGKSEVELQDYVNEQLNSALWLIKSIEQRRRTIYNIVQAIIDLQRDFLAGGLEYLKPMTMQEVADAIDMHESTVSRATSDKYIQTPHGLFEMKFFFSESIKTKSGFISAVSVKQKLKTIIEEEDKAKPLSDQKIVDKLKAMNIDISRRTIANYRKELSIPSSRQRKRYVY